MLNLRKAVTPAPVVAPESPVTLAQFVPLAQTVVELLETVKGIRVELADTRAELARLREQNTRLVADSYVHIRKHVESAPDHNNSPAPERDSVNGPVAASPAAISSGEQGISYIASKMGQNRRTIGKRLAESDQFAQLRALCGAMPITRNVGVMRWLADQAPAHDEIRYALLARGAYSLAELRKLDKLAAAADQKKDAA